MTAWQNVVSVTPHDAYGNEPGAAELRAVLGCANHSKTDCSQPAGQGVLKAKELTFNF